MPITAELYVVVAHFAPAAGASVRTDGASSLGTSSAGLRRRCEQQRGGDADSERDRP